ncbi:MAG: hypothetical protein NC293_02860 [Roseburia sp.]|nr:hypothetical protein [Roseburia sp.]
MNKKKRLFAVLLIGALVLSMFAGMETEAKKKKKLKFNKTKITMKVGNEKFLKIKNNTEVKSVKWRSSNKKVVNFVTKSEQDCWLVANKVGTAKITAKIGKVKLKCKVKVKARSKTSKDSTARRPIVTATPVPTESPLTEADIKENRNALKNYLLASEFTHDDGSKYILRLGRTILGDMITTTITYKPQEQVYEFQYHVTGSGIIRTSEILTMKINEQDWLNAELTFYYYSSSRFTNQYVNCNAVAIISNTGKDSTLAWTETESNNINLANNCFTNSYQEWEELLKTAGLSMEKIGFLRTSV